MDEHSGRFRRYEDFGGKRMGLIDILGLDEAVELEKRLGIQFNIHTVV